MLIIVIICTISNALGTIAFWGGAESSGLPFYDKMCYPTFVVRILLDNNIYPKTNHIGPLDFKWLLTGPLQSREIVKLHLAGKGYLGFVVGQILLSILILTTNVG